MAEKTFCEACNRNFPNQDALNMHNSAKHQNISEPKKNHAKTIFIVIIISLLLIGGFFFFNNTINGNSIANPNNSGEVQKITLSFKNYNYYPQTITVKEGIPVEITLDSSIRGCFRTFVIKDLGVRQTSSKPSNTILFTPDKKGSFVYACGMHMGTGTIIVE
ncbi:cupredoxin domain-containing protein [Candidatus Pacearchaeota archaeon]|nr:cupredoxin domain-containing protein [Candidatus Pacearchaeota archaeon]